MLVAFYVKCPECKGENKECEHCKGSGYISAPHKIQNKRDIEDSNIPFSSAESK